MKAIRIFEVLCLLSLFALSCSKDDSSSDGLGGDTTIALTEVGSKTDVFGQYDNQSISNAGITVKSRDNGIVTYEAEVDLNPFSDALKLKAVTTLTQLADYYDFDTSFTLTPENHLKFTFKLKVTSEGYLDYFVEGKPWVIGKYGDGVGTKYTIENEKGETLSRTITEKTGLDDFPLTPFFYIKTSKIEQNAPADDPVISKVIYRINHRFGLVYVEYQLKDGTVLKLNAFASFI